MKFKLYKHQKKMVKLSHKALKKHKHLLFGSPTGSGKSVMILDMVQGFINNGERVLVIAPYRKLIFQLMETFENESPALMMGTDGYGDVKSSYLIVASLSTLSRRLQKDPLLLGGIDKVVIDEAHLSFNIPNGKPTKIIAELYKRYWNTAQFIGFTATPITAGGYRLEGWDHSIYKYNTKWLIDHGWLSKFEYYSVPEIDGSGLRVQSSTGDYSTADMETVTNTPTAIKSVHENFLKFGATKKTLIFAASIEHAKLIQEYFLEVGVASRVIHSMLKENEQRKILEEYKNNVFNVLINVAMLTTGFDDPEVEMLLIARPIGSKRLAIQVWGRVLRVHAAFDEVIILDMASVYLKCGLPDDEVNWNREKKPKGEKQEVDNSIEDVVKECRTCQQVYRMIDAKRSKVVSEKLIEVTYICPNCGEVADIVTTEMETVEVSKIQTASDIDFSKKYNRKEVMQMLGELIKMNTKAKTSWGTFIHRQCLKNDKKGYRTALYGYAQEVYSAGQAWRRVMNIYG